MSTPALTKVTSAFDGLCYPTCPPGTGPVIRSLQDAQLIEGVQIEEAKLHPDDRGYFLEIIRLGQGLAAKFDPKTTQVSSALSYPGTIKAFHYHLRQTDLWAPAMGMFQVALVDLRRDSPDFGVKNTMYVGHLQPWRILIPPGVAHGYKVIGSDPGMLVYVTDKFYDPSDEGRIAYNHPSLVYDWDTQHK